MLNIHIFLPKDRRRDGYLHLFDHAGQLLWADMPARGKADNANAAKHRNPDRVPTRPWGDTPAGRYKATKVIRYAPRHKTFGDRAILLEGISGDANKAKAGGRTGLAIHGGRGNDKLIATYGCVRVRDHDFEAIDLIIGDELVSITIQDTGVSP